MVAILQKSEHNVGFHLIVDFVEASHLRYTLTFKPTVYVSHVRQFWSTARIETTEEGTKILATLDGNLITVSESSIRQNLKLNDEAGISSLPDAELFKNLTLMGYNISPNQKFTFQNGQFSHQWKYLIHTIMQCLSPKSTGFNEFSSNNTTALVILATNRVYNFSKMIFDGMVKNVNNKVSKFLMYPRFLSICLRMGQFGKITHTHTYVVPFHTRKLFTTLRVNSLSFSGRIVPLFDFMLTPQGEGSGTPTEPHYIPSLEVRQTSPTTHSSPILLPVTTAPIPIVTLSDTPHLRQYTRRARIAQSSALPPIADEHASPLRDVSQGEACPTISSLDVEQDKANIAKTSTLPHESTSRVSFLAADEGNDTPIKGMSLDEGEELAEKGSNNTKEMINVLTSMDAVTVLSSGVAEVPTGSGSIPTAGPHTAEVPTGSDVVPTVGPIFATATVMEEKMERKAQKMNEQIVRDAEIARIHAEEELQIMIDGLDRSNETVAKYLQEYHQFAMELPIERRIELISDLVRYQDNYAKVHKYQSQQRKPLTKKQHREFYTLVLRNQARWKAKDFKGMTLKEIKGNFDLVWKQIHDFIPIGSKEEAERFKRKGIRFEQESVKKLKTSNIRPAASDKEMELWVEIKRLYEPDDENQLWTHTQNIMHAPIEWKLYDSYGVHHVTFKDKEIFMLVEKDYPLRKGLVIVMISYKLQVENYSQMASDLILKIYKIANHPRQEDD
nr:hypothetical protein [Tanacetum cinerariifolium]